MCLLLFLGGFWYGAGIIVMFLAIHSHLELGRLRRQRWPVTATSPFWVDWRSETSQLARRGWTMPSDDTESGSSLAEESLYEEVQVREAEVEYTEVADWDPDSTAIHYWRPFDEPSSGRASYQTWRGKYDMIYYMIQRDPDCVGQV